MDLLFCDVRFRSKLIKHLIQKYGNICGEHIIRSILAGYKRYLIEFVSLISHSRPGHSLLRTHNACWGPMVVEQEGRRGCCRENERSLSDGALGRLETVLHRSLLVRLCHNASQRRASSDVHWDWQPQPPGVKFHISFWFIWPNPMELVQTRPQPRHSPRQWCECKCIPWSMHCLVRPW